ncbi:hypothetical protein GCM10011608_53880 [Micromonospora sonchi]|uniref:Uncharacterized protein n=1 Tax=Micromonospora sonchi TaxID=1763543 RepID=A0A917X3R5_9ACTN|nr:hypothetical protein [Micromonospora sonchi]GGM61988.1 hypothetical protein GCM10011608_53880 [Micromonospora sonchi]
MTELERRYRRLLRAYPTDYRRDRGDEIVGTYLDLAGPGRRWPSLADAADLGRGGLRQRLRAAGATDLIPGVRLAGLLALITAAFLAGFWTLVERNGPDPELGVPGFGPFVSVGVIAWLAWLAPALLMLFAPGRPTRVAVTVAVLATAMVPVVSGLADVPRPPLYALASQFALGVLALAVGNRLPLPARALPGTAALAGAGTALFLVGPAHWSWYGWRPEDILPATGGMLLALAIVLAIGLGIRRDAQGGWTVAALLTPIGLLSVHILAGIVDAVASGAPRPTYPTLIATAVAVALLGPALLPAAVALRGRYGTGRARPLEPCPTCGAPR